MSDGGKGSKARPIEVDAETYANNWDRIFKKNPKKDEESAIMDDSQNNKETTDESVNV